MSLAVDHLQAPSRGVSHSQVGQHAAMAHLRRQVFWGAAEGVGGGRALESALGETEIGDANVSCTVANDHTRAHVFAATSTTQFPQQDTPLLC